MHPLPVKSINFARQGHKVQNNYTDTTLIEQLSAGNEAAFAFVFQKYHHAILTNIGKLICHQHEAEDILQEVFITLWQNRHKLTQYQSLAGWLFTTSYYKSLEHLRKAIRQSMQLIDEHMAVPERELPAGFENEYADKLTVLHAAIESLPQRKRAAFTLCRLEGKTYEEAADELGISRETVKDYVKSSAKFLKEYVMAQRPTMSAISASCLVIYLQL